MKVQGILIFVFCFLSFCPETGFASDESREADYAELIAKTRPSGKIVWLESGAKRFLGLYAESEQKISKGTLIILHDQGGHPNQLEVIKSLRTSLPVHGWSTLSLQMPLRETGVTEDEYFDLFPDSQARIEAAIKYLKDNKVNNIVLAGYGLGALMAISAQSEKKLESKAIAAISLAAPDSSHKSAQTLKFIKDINIPLLDIFAERDQPAVVNSAKDRRIEAKENRAYRQIMINDENHLFLHNQELLVKRIYSWIERNQENQKESVGTAVDTEIKNNVKQP